MPTLLPDNGADPNHNTHDEGGASAGNRAHLAARGLVANG